MSSGGVTTMKTEPAFDYEGCGHGEGRLKCPRCDTFDYLHHETVEVFARPEDAPMVRHVAVDPDGAIRTAGADVNAISRNPSKRRDGVVIHFRCEGCGEGLLLNISQHKGQTFVHWSEQGR
jgi:hypothetical protein